MAIIIFTDLDGTLLNHDSYRFDAAAEYLKALERRGIRVIFVTSKTRLEVLEIRDELNNRQPFVVENGAAVYLPVEYPPPTEEALEMCGEYYVKPFGGKRAQWLDLLALAKQHFPGCFSGFNDCSVEEIAKLTGLGLDGARAAVDREFTEPISWHGDDRQLNQFVPFMSQNGASIMRGGRFIHVGGGGTKGQATSWLVNYFSRLEALKTVAVGDSENDIPMLNVTDYAVIVKNPKGNGIKLKPRADKEVVYTTLAAPEGWVEGVSYILEKLGVGDVK